MATSDNETFFWDLDDLLPSESSANDQPRPQQRLLYEFEPQAVTAILQFLWQLSLEEGEVKSKPYTPSLYPQQGYQLAFTEQTRAYVPLLDTPEEGESKLGQIVRFLEKGQ